MNTGIDAGSGHARTGHRVVPHTADVLYNGAFVVAGLALIPLWRLGRERQLLWWIAAANIAAALLVAKWMTTWPWSTRRTGRSTRHDVPRSPGSRRRRGVC